jgi:Major royal jelly protein
MPYAAPGGPKLVVINLSNDSIVRTYTLPPNVHYPDSYMNDLRFDMRANATASGGGIAYIVDSSNEGRTGFIMIDLELG